MNKLTFLIISIFLIPSFFIPNSSFASIGVGVNLGKIKIDEPLKPGGIYNLPVIGVINTGDEAGDYELDITYHQDQPEIRPAQKWFIFNPSQFSLGPGESQNVAVKLSLPVKIKPGEYFAYIEAHPVVQSGPGTTIGIAAATKTYFTVAPANIWQAIIWRVYSFFGIYAPWSYIILIITIGAILITIFRQYFSFQVGIRRKP